MKIIGVDAIEQRKHLVNEIRQLSGDFGKNFERLEVALSAEIRANPTKLLDHLRLCGDIPESYQHDSTEEKLYSKYTDALLAEVFRALGLTALVLTERADAADVEVVAKGFGFVADAKAFRLSRTAKNQKDFKIQAMDGWKRGKPYAMVVCPIYQLPSKSSQIYQQASARNVCVLTYSHLAMLVSFSLLAGQDQAVLLLHQIFKTIPALNPAKEATAYWLAVNRTMLDFSAQIENLWKIEKQAALESIAAAKEEALVYLAEEREKIMRMTREEAVLELVKVHKLDSRIKVINSLTDNRLLEIR